VYDHWKLALLFYFGSGIALAVFWILYPSPTFSVNLTANLVLALAFAPGFIYIFSEFARLADAPDSSSKRAVKIMIIGFAAFFGFGVAIPHSYAIVLDAFNVSLPYDPSFRFLLITGDLAGKFAMGLAAVFARKIGPHEFSPEPEKTQPGRVLLGEGLESMGIGLIIFGFVIGVGVFALAAFFLIIAGTIFVPIGYIIRKFWH
jgi:hypothetical protein